MSLLLVGLADLSRTQVGSAGRVGRRPFKRPTRPGICRKTQTQGSGSVRIRPVELYVTKNLVGCRRRPC